MLFVHAAAAPPTDAPSADAAELAHWLQARRHVTVITGAGVSTDSGIPDYRDADGQWKRSAPMTHQQFTRNTHARQRYWVRSFAGWSHFSGAQPNAAHRALATLEQRGLIEHLVTQNVDGLHERAGSHAVIDLHGRLDRVVCLACGYSLPRDELQRQMAALNPGWADRTDLIAPDGDADIEGVDFDAFRVPACPRCGGLLKPDVVYYGGLVPAAWRAAADAAIAAADGVLVVGSSLMVWSSFRLVRTAVARGMSVAAVNRGRTRADDLLAFKVPGDCGAILQDTLRALPP